MLTSGFVLVAGGGSLPPFDSSPTELLNEDIKKNSYNVTVIPSFSKRLKTD